MLNKSLTEKQCLLLSTGNTPTEGRTVDGRERETESVKRKEDKVLDKRWGVVSGILSFFLKKKWFQNKNNQNQLIIYLPSAESFICIKDICKITRHFHWKYCSFPLPGQFVLIWYCRITFSVRSPCVIYQCLLLLKARIEPFLCIEQCAIKKKQALCAQ